MGCNRNHGPVLTTGRSLAVQAPPQLGSSVPRRGSSHPDVRLGPLTFSGQFFVSQDPLIALQQYQTAKGCYLRLRLHKVNTLSPISDRPTGRRQLSFKGFGPHITPMPLTLWITWVLPNLYPYIRAIKPKNATTLA